MGLLQSDSSQKIDWCMQAHQLIRSRQYRKALHTLDRAIEGNAAHAKAYFLRGVCHYLMGNYHLTKNDMDAAAILGYRDAQLWSKFEMKETKKNDLS